ncbi:MAG: SurA N-terminal domain-containing protein [Coriobacteriia bacterium]|nr:SurA N-terminal domain-containing protein [Coriobacteriia bacterium]
MLQREKYDRGKQGEQRGSGQKQPGDASKDDVIDPDKESGASDLPPIPDDSDLDLDWGTAKMPDFSDEPATSLPVGEMSGDAVYAAADAVDSTDATVISIADKAMGADSDDDVEGAKRSFLIPLVAIAAVLVIAVAAWFVIANTSLFGGGVAARVNGDAITIVELDFRVEAARAQNPVMFSVEAGGLEEGMARQLILDAMIDDILLVQEAYREGIQIGDAEVQADIADRIARYPSEAEFDEDLRAFGMTREQFEEQLRMVLAIDALIEYLVPASEITDDDAREYYEDNIELFIEPGADGEEGEPIPFDEVVAELHNLLLGSLRNIVHNELIERLREEATISVRDPVVVAFEEAGGSADDFIIDDDDADVAPEGDDTDANDADADEE